MTNVAEKHVKFEMGNIASDSIKDEDLEQNNTRALTRPGEYEFTLTRATFSAEPKTDNAGNRWHGCYIQGETSIEGIKYRAGTFINVPVDALEYVGNSGKKSKFFMHQVKSLLSSVIGEEIGTVVSLLDHIRDIQSTLVPNVAKFKAYVGASGDRVTFAGDKENQVFKIALKNGGFMLNDYGAEITAPTREAAAEAYEQATGRKPKMGLEITKFLPRNS